jgi:hypothetical protein
MDRNLELVNEILDSPKVETAPKALILLKLVSFFRLFSPDKLDDYWKRLIPLKSSIPDNYKKDFDAIQKVKEPEPTHKVREFAAKVISEIDKIPKSDINATVEVLKGIEKQLKKVWWRSGRKPIWKALMNVWLDIDRGQAIRLMKKTESKLQADLISGWNRDRPLSKEEWKMVPKSLAWDKSIENIIEDMLSISGLILLLPEDILNRVASYLKSKIVVAQIDPEDKKQEEAFKNYIRFVSIVESNDKEISTGLMKSLFSTAIKTDSTFSHDFINGFYLVRKILVTWYAFEGQRNAAISYIEKETPKFLFDFVISNWYAQDIENIENIENNYVKLLEKTNSSKNAELYFLVRLIDMGYIEIAHKLALNSAKMSLIINNIQRCIICNSSEAARKLISIPDSEDDPIGYFFILPDIPQRVEYLKNITNNGSKSLPQVFWKKPVLSDANNDPGSVSLYNYYMRDAPKAKYFDLYLKLFGYHWYGSQDVDLYLCQTLHHWAENDRDAVAGLLKIMWDDMRPIDSDLQSDLLRNSIFERCRLVFSALPSQLYIFIEWLNQRFVKDSYQYQIGNTQYTLSFKKDTLLLHCIIAAEKIRIISIKTSDEIILHAMKNFTGAESVNEDYVRSAANVYSSEKSPEAIFEDHDFSKSALRAWQLGIVEATLPSILNEMVPHES